MMRTEFMGWIQNQTIGVRLRYGFGIVVALVLLLGAVAMIEMHTMAGFTRDMHDHPLMVGNAVREIRSEVVEIRRDIKDLVLEGSADQIQAVLDKMSHSEKAVESLFQILRERYLGD